MDIYSEKILILDFGSQYTMLIARRVRESGVYSEIKPFNISMQEVKKFSPKGIILSGSPSSIYEDDSPKIHKAIFDLNIPILGICYGMQVICDFFGGIVSRSRLREYGNSKLILKKEEDLFSDVLRKDESLTVWMSYGDKLEKKPDNFEVIAYSTNAPIAAMKHKEAPIYALQFHPEVAHTEKGAKILKNFIVKICGCEPVWTPGNFVQNSVSDIRETVGNAKVLCALSGGVDSSITAALISRAIGKHLTCIFVNNGLLRLNEPEHVVNNFSDFFDVDLKYIDAEKEFLDVLKGVINPEIKRKRIGNLFIKIFEKEAKKIGRFDFLAQGTLYPDVIESASSKGTAVTIKTHHNVGGLPEKMDFKLIEPLRYLFKDEVRKAGVSLGLPEDMVYRHPFPGPGLAVRVLGEVNKERLDMLRLADDIFISALKDNHIYNDIWQAFAVLLPVRSVGVMGDERTYENAIALRAVNSVDGMTAKWSEISYKILAEISGRIINEVKGINRVVYDISSKPPATIEWE